MNRYSKFPLIPVLDIRKKSIHNTFGFTFKWMFFTVWTLDHVKFEIAIVASTHWGFGIIGILPYLRWAVCVPCPSFIEKLIRKLDRVLKQQ